VRRFKLSWNEARPQASRRWLPRTKISYHSYRNVSNSEEHDRKQQPPYYDSALIIDTRLSEVERQQREDKAESKKHNRSQHVTNWLLTIFTGLLFVTSVVSNVLILRQLKIAKESADAAMKSATLGENITKGTDSAYLFTDVVPQAIRTVDDLQRGVLVRFHNRGKVVAPLVETTSKLSLQYFPSGKTIRSKTIVSKKDQLRPIDDIIIVTFEDFIHEQDIGLLESDDATLMAQIEFSYSNGFGDLIHDSACKLYFVRHFPDTGVVTERNWGAVTL
jgi:hypothetical protein